MFKLDIFTGMVFLSAALLRILCKKCRLDELSFFGLENYNFISYLIIIYELYVGYYFITKKYKKDKFKSKLLLKSLIYLLPLTMIIIFFKNYNNIITTFWEICTYQPTSMSLILHFTYLLIILHLYKTI
jgi:hypothetical protein